MPTNSSSRRAVWSSGLIWLTWIAAATAADPPSAPPVSGPLAADKSLAHFRLEPNLAVDLIAAEPTVVAPCALAFDSQGRLFVAENRGYPLGGPDGSAVGRIVRLVDEDGDGRAERRVDFATDLTFPNGLLPWRDGLIVTCAPEVLFLRDRDGDGRADERKVLLTGFSTAGSTQLRVSHPSLAIDGWLYVTSGLTGGAVACPDLPAVEPLKIGRTDLRFRLAAGADGLPRVTRFEPCDGGSQFGLSFDDFGRRFICYNRVQVQHVVLGSVDLRRNPNLAFSETVQNCPADLAPEPVRGHGAAARLFPLSQNVTTADSHAGTFTAACGVTIWRGSNLPDAYRGGVFSCDPTANVVHFDRLDPVGATFAARRVREGVEFLASPDGWFRPVYLAPGPDGALYICDMYRKTIEHPDYLPVEIRKRTDFESGRDLGRIWRVRRADRTPADLRRQASEAAAALQVDPPIDALAAADGWLQDSAFRRSVESIEAPVEAVVRSWEQRLSDAAAEPTATVRIARLLHESGRLTDDRLRGLLSRSSAGVREQAALLMRERGAAAGLVAQIDDADPRVRFQAALALGDVRGGELAGPLARVALRDARDRWLRAAVLSSLAGREIEFLQALIDAKSDSTPGLVNGERESSAEVAAATLELYHELGRLLGAARPVEEASALADRLTGAGGADDDRRTAALTGLAEALRARGAGRDGAGPLALLVAADKPGGAGRAAAIDRLIGRALQTAQDESSPAARRASALALLAQSDFERVGAALLPLVDPRQPDAVQSGAVRALGLMRSDRIAAELLSSERFPSYTPRLREDVLTTLVSGSQHLPGLLAAIESGVVPRGAVDSLRRRQLVEHRDPAIKARALKLFDAAAAGDRAKIYESLKDVVSMTPDPTNGQAVFKRSCAPCHRLDREGFPVGPDLFGIRNQPKEAILLHIVIPEHEITPGFAAYVVTTADGRVLTGLIAAETPTGITLRQALGKEETILRKDVAELSASRLSLMPQELEKTHTRQEFADLLAYLKGEKP